MSPKNVVVQFVPYKDTGQRDRSNTIVPEAELVGTGEMWAFSDGKVIKGTWNKPALEAPTTYLGADGQPIKLTPGQTWLELPEARNGRAALIALRVPLAPACRWVALLRLRWRWDDLPRGHRERRPTSSPTRRRRRPPPPRRPR